MSNLQNKKKRSEMSDLERVQDFQRKIYQKAKQDKGFIFYLMYDKVRLPHFLREAYRRVRINKGASGVDNKSFEDIENDGLENFLTTIIKELEEETYRPQAVKRVYIKKENGDMRPIGIPTIKDRVVQMSCKMVIEPIFEADFEESSYGFRPKRAASDAITQIRKELLEGNTEVYDADLSKYFDTIPHDKLFKTIGLRISDSKIFHLIKMWLKSPVEEDGKLTGGKNSKIGTPQGGVISPLLANIYFNLVDKIVSKTTSIFSKQGIKIIRYADDFVLMGEQITEEAITQLKHLLERMGLKLNETKTRLVKAKEESFRFLGFEIRYDKDIKGRDKRYWNIKPSDKSLKKVKANIEERLKRMGHLPATILVKELNPVIRGWINYFSIKGVSYPAMSKRKLRWYLCEKLYRYYRRKSQRKSKLYNQKAFEVLVNKYGLIDPTKYSCC